MCHSFLFTFFLSNYMHNKILSQRGHVIPPHTKKNMFYPLRSWSLCANETSPGSELDSVFVNFCSFFVSKEWHLSWNCCMLFPQAELWWLSICRRFLSFSHQPSASLIPSTQQKFYRGNWHVVKTGYVVKASPDFNLSFPFWTTIKSHNASSSPSKNLSTLANSIFCSYPDTVTSILYWGKEEIEE